MPYYVTIQEAEQKWEAERQLDREGMQAEASSEELQRMLDELRELLQENYFQVSATVHICIGSSYDTPPSLHLETFPRGAQQASISLVPRLSPSCLFYTRDLFS